MLQMLKNKRLLKVLVVIKVNKKYYLSVDDLKGKDIVVQTCVLEMNSMTVKVIRIDDSVISVDVIIYHLDNRYD